MNENKYYIEIENIIQNIEVNSQVRALQENNERLKSYWKIGKLLVEAQNGIARAKYGDTLLKKWSFKLVAQYGRGYDLSNLKRFRMLYIQYPKGGAMSHQLTWTHYRYLLPIKNENERNYYINQVILNNLSSRELIALIKSKAFERLSYTDRENIKLIIDNTYTLAIEDMIKDPILIKVSDNIQDLEEKVLHKYIIQMLEDKFLELGVGFALVGHEYKINVPEHTYRLDLLFLILNLIAMLL
ncbi:MAG: PDDEXK nuclease domain-containing protein [Bacilli bacterium]|nr:PDDEXK nuclease domain-containing protein [Bacilli bacterium]